MLMNHMGPPRSEEGCSTAFTATDSPERPASPALRRPGPFLDMGHVVAAFPACRFHPALPTH
jgi:hypothetical protein